MSVNSVNRNSKFIRGTYNSCVRKTPILNKIIKSEESWKRVTTISFEVLKGLGMVIAGASFGAMIGISFEGMLPVLICTGVGAATAGAAYLVAKVAVELIKKFGYPASKFLEEKPLAREERFSDKNRDYFDKILKSFEKETWFKNWQKLHGSKKPERILWRGLQKGSCFGECSAILQEAQKKPTMRSSKLLRKVKEKQVFQKQILEIIRSDIVKALNGKDKKLNGVSRETLEKDLQTVLELTRKVDGAHVLPASHFSKDTILHPAKFSKQLREVLSEAENRHPKRPVMSIIRIESKRKAHAIFAQFSENQLRIYDPYNSKTGFYKFQDAPSLETNLQKILKSYIKVPSLTFHTYRDAKIQIYAV